MSYIDFKALRETLQYLRGILQIHNVHLPSKQKYSDVRAENMPKLA